MLLCYFITHNMYPMVEHHLYSFILKYLIFHFLKKMFPAILFSLVLSFLCGFLEFFIGRANSSTVLILATMLQEKV